MGIGNLSNVLRAYAPRQRLDRARPRRGGRSLLGARLLRHGTRSKRRSARACSHGWATTRRPTTGACSQRRRSCGSTAKIATACRSSTSCTGRKASAEEVLHPPFETERFADATDLQRAWDDSVLHPLPDDPARLGFAVDPTMGELAPRLGQPTELYRGLRAEALAMLVYIGTRVQELSAARPGRSRSRARYATTPTRSSCARETPKRRTGTRSTPRASRSTFGDATSQASRRRRSSSCWTTSPRAT